MCDKSRDWQGPTPDKCASGEGSRQVRPQRSLRKQALLLAADWSKPAADNLNLNII